MNIKSLNSNDIQIENDFVIKNSFFQQAIASVSSSQMYNAIGIKTPIIQIKQLILLFK